MVVEYQSEGGVIGEELDTLNLTLALHTHYGGTYHRTTVDLHDSSFPTNFLC